MVEETKLLVRAFHALEDHLPPLVPLRAVKSGGKSATAADWTTVATATFRMAREVERILVSKLELWRRLGADDNEARGLLVAFTEDGAKVRLWIGITALVGLVDAAEVRDAGIVGHVGKSPEALLIDLHEGPVAVYFDEIEATCTRPEAAGKGAPSAFKEWWAAHLKSRKSSAA